MGLPDRSYPKYVNNRSVKLSQGELMLCPSGEAAQFHEAAKPGIVTECADKQTGGDV
jgi:hypothetical protein